LIIFDEKKYAENLLLNGYKNVKYVGSDNIILVKYWKYLGLQENEIRIKLKNFMIDFQDLYSADISNSKVDSAIKIGMQYDLSTDIEIQIYKKEIELINTLQTIELRKMMFILLIIWKFRGRPKRFKVKNVDLLRLTEIKINNNVFWEYINEITKTKMLSLVGYDNKDYYAVNFDLEDNENEIVFSINNYSNPIYYYLSLVEPDKYKNCVECGVKITLLNNKIKFCKECAKIIKNEQNKKYYHEDKN